MQERQQAINLWEAIPWGLLVRLGEYPVESIVIHVGYVVPAAVLLRVRKAFDYGFGFLPLHFIVKKVDLKLHLTTSLDVCVPQVFER